VTNSVAVAQTLVGTRGIRVHLLGGEMQSDERGTFGHVTHRQLQRYAFDLAVLSTDAISARKGFLYQSLAEVDLASVAIGNADNVVMAASHYKFGETAPYVGPDPRMVRTVVTDKSPEEPLASSFAEWGIDVQVAAPE
jgi:DeoR family glycerol-3-phosphate regulon repressor